MHASYHFNKTLLVTTLVNENNVIVSMEKGKTTNVVFLGWEVKLLGDRRLHTTPKIFG